MKNGATHQSKCKHDIVVREANISDATALRQMKLDYLKNTTTLPLFADEYKNTIEEEGQLIKRFAEEKNSRLLVAEYEGDLIGNIDLFGNQRRKLYHTGMIGMGISNEWQSRGIGTMLMDEMLSWAKTNKYIEIVWLEVYDSNIGGKKLYAKAGFKECGRIKNFFRENDQKIDNIKMVIHI